MQYVIVVNNRQKALEKRVKLRHFILIIKENMVLRSLTIIQKNIGYLSSFVLKNKPFLSILAKCIYSKVSFIKDKQKTGTRQFPAFAEMCRSIR